VRQVASDLPGDWTGVRLEGVRDRYVGPLRTIILSVTAGSVFVLLIVATNLAVLTLLRTMRRRKELVVRTALGATRLQTVRLLAAESALVCGAGLAGGLALASLVLPLLAPEIAIRLGKPAPGGEAALTVGATVLASVSAIAVLIVLLLSTLPLLAGWHRDAATFLASDRSGASENRAMRRARGVLVAAQVAGTLVLLAGAFLLTRAVAGLLDTDLGFRPDGLVHGRIVLREQDHAGPEAFWQVRNRFADQAGALLRAPVVFTSWPPFAERPAQLVEADSAGSAARRAGVIDVGHAYFEVLDVRLRQGRPFSAAEVQGDAPVAIVSETLARQFWPDGGGGGRRIRTIEPTPDGPRTNAWRTVIGVAADVRQGYSDAELADIYLPLSPADAGRFGTFYVRSEDSAAMLLPRLRDAARGVDAHAVIDNVRLASEGNQQLEGARWLARVLTTAAAAALLLALVGIYGVMAYAVQQRGRETAIRIALGATAGAIRRMFLAECGMLVASGLALGLFGSLALSRWLAGQVPGVPGLSLGPVVSAAFVLGLSAALASWWPARRASLTDPGRGLRE
jgi:putative ABC transport system permease protein